MDTIIPQHTMSEADDSIAVVQRDAEELHVGTSANGAGKQRGESGAGAERGRGRGRGGRGGGGGAKGGRGGGPPTVQLSKALSYILRHGIVSEGLPVRADGYVPLDAVLARPRVAKVVMPETNASPTIDDVRAVVDTNDKKRFEMRRDDDDAWLIRAVQGHSLTQVQDLDHRPITLDTLHILAGDGSEGQGAKDALPDGVEILHGTTRDAWRLIQESGGLRRMKRNHIHLARGRPGGSGAAAVISGMRATSAVVLHIDMIAALRDGVVFQLASNGAVLTSGEGEAGLLPLRYIVRAEDGKTGGTLWEPKAGQ